MAVSGILSISAKDTPIMGWSSWNTYRVNISDSLIMSQADAMVRHGLDSVGYEFINIDDGYFGGRDSITGELLVHPMRFPGGLRPVVDHIHSLGLRAGIYSDAGVSTCGFNWDNDTIARNVGLYGHEYQAPLVRIRRTCRLILKNVTALYVMPSRLRAVTMCC